MAASKFIHEDENMSECRVCKQSTSKITHPIDVAQMEIRQEVFDQLVLDVKARIRDKKTLWDRLVPFNITITRK
jgi:hypothetical protein